MRWSERQLLLLREMGLRLWLPAMPAEAAPGEAPAPAGAATPAAPAVVAAPAGCPAAPVAGPAVTAATVERDEGAGPAERAEAPASPWQPPAPAPAPAVATGVAVPALAGGAGASAVVGLDWAGLRAAVAGCRACSLCETRRQTVFGTGHERSRCMIVGEAPGEQEDLSGEPFVGAAGQLLDRMLAALGLARSGGDPAHQVFIANTLKCRPPRNRNPTPQELSTCQPFLERQVALVQPRVILAMGRFAVQSLLGSDEAVGRLRGRLHTWRGVPLVVTYHPAYLLRQPADKARAWDDLCLAASCLESDAG